MIFCLKFNPLNVNVLTLGFKTVDLTPAQRRLFLLVPVLLILSVLPAKGQYKNERDATIPLEHFYIERKGTGIFRPWLSKLYWSFSTGFGSTNFRHDLSGFGVIKAPGLQPAIFSNGNTGVRFTNWITNAVDTTLAVPAGSFVVSSDTAELGFKSRMITIPLKLSVHVELNRYRIGAGYSMDYTRIGPFKPISYSDDIGDYEIDKGGFFMKRYFIMAGATVYRYYEYAVVADVNVGGYKLGRQFNSAVIQKGMYFNLGLKFERDFSEYFRVFVRPSFEFNGYSIRLPETSQSISHKLNGMFVNIGVTYRLPDLPRCYNKHCHAQVNHVHGNKEYRSRRHPFYKKQNPHYGENYPTLLKYKGKNKRKLNPY